MGGGYCLWLGLTIGLGGHLFLGTGVEKLHFFIGKRKKPCVVGRRNAELRQKQCFGAPRRAKIGKNCVSGHPDGWKTGKTVFRGTPTGGKTEKTAQIRG